MKATGKALVGDDRLIVPRKLVHMYNLPPPFSFIIFPVVNLPRYIIGGKANLEVYRYVSPRMRAQRTLELLRLGLKERLPWTKERQSLEEEPMRTEAKVQVTDAIREWDYGEYEGKTSKQIKEEREEKGLGKWDIWRHGCPGGEYVLPFYFHSCSWFCLLYTRF